MTTRPYRLTLPDPPEASFQKAKRRLRSAFADFMVSYGWVDGPFRRIYLARTQQGLCRVSFRDEEQFVKNLERLELLPVKSPEKLDRERRQFEDYFEGRRKRFRLAMDLRSVTDFQRQVLDAACEIPFGQVASYADLARRIGKPRAPRAVGNALGRNPLGIVIPCHRVVTSEGGIGGYTGGLHIKRALFRIEGIELERGKA